MGAEERLVPMAATLTDRRFSDPDWIFEAKLDGIRALAVRDGAEVRLRSRTGRSMAARFPEIVAALGADPCADFVADGEIVAFDGRVTSFARLQSDAAVPVFLYLFDLIRLEGGDLREEPLRRRKSLLRGALAFEDPIRFLPHRNAEGERLYAEACAGGLEGVIAKRADSPYAERRSPDWLKMKCDHRQELVVGGFTAPKGTRAELGALLVGHYEAGALRYAGKVGTGFDAATLRDLGGRLRALERDEPPFADLPRRRPVARWVRPELVVEVGFTEWTRDGRLRHPRYLGLRDDKPAAEVVRERPS